MRDKIEAVIFKDGEMITMFSSYFKNRVILSSLTFTCSSRKYAYD